MTVKDVSKVARTPCKPIRYRIAVHRFDREGKRQSINPTENDSFRRDGNVGKGGKVVRYETLLNCARREGREGGRAITIEWSISPGRTRSVKQDC